MQDSLITLVGIFLIGEHKIPDLTAAAKRPDKKCFLFTIGISAVFYGCLIHSHELRWRSI